MKVETVVPQLVDAASLVGGDVFALQDQLPLLFIVVASAPLSVIRATDGTPSGLPAAGVLVAKYPNAVLIAQP